MSEPNNSPPATRVFELAVTLLSDLHAGSGLGGAGVDALVARDRSGLPCIRWTHFKGLLREACLERFDALGKPEEGRIAAGRLFGSESRSRDGRGLVVGTSLRAKPGITAGRAVWSSTAREEDERSPREDSLRRIEYIGAGAAFAGQLRLPDSEADVALVRKLLLRISRIGRGKSRGDGLVHVSLEERVLQAPGVRGSGGTTGDRPRFFRIVLQAVEPVCIGSAADVRNLVPSHSHLPASAVSGSLARWALDSARDSFAAAVIDAAVTVSPAYPVPPGWIDVLASEPQAAGSFDAVPAPLSLHAPKGSAQDDAVPWWARDAAPDPLLDQVGVEVRTLGTVAGAPRLKRLPAHVYACTRDGGERWFAYSCPLQHVMRNSAGTSRRRGQIPDLFTVEEIAEGTGFVATVSAEPAFAAALGGLLEDFVAGDHWLRIGRGGAPVRIAGWAELPSSKQSNPVPAASSAGHPRCMRIFIESDLVLRSADFRFHARLDTPGVAALLACSGVSPEAIGKATVAQEFSESAAVYGWNVAVGGARLPATSVRRGSVALVVFDDETAAAHARERLNAVAAQGVGERTREGFGRIRIDFQPMLCALPDEPIASEDRVREASLARVEEAWASCAFKGDIPASRWSALGDCIGETQVEAWIEQTMRRLSGRTDPWFDRVRAPNADAEFRKLLGSIAAKRAQARRLAAEGGA